MTEQERKSRLFYSEHTLNVCVWLTVEREIPLRTHSPLLFNSRCLFLGVFSRPPLLSTANVTMLSVISEPQTTKCNVCACVCVLVWPHLLSLTCFAHYFRHTHSQSFSHYSFFIYKKTTVTTTPSIYKCTMQWKQYWSIWMRKMCRAFETAFKSIITGQKSLNLR